MVSRIICLENCCQDKVNTCSCAATASIDGRVFTTDFSSSGGGTLTGIAKSWSIVMN